MRTIIAGSRTCVEPAEINKAIEGCPWRITSVIGGEAEGADYLGKQWALANLGSAKYEAFPANWSKEGKEAGHLRNERMAFFAEALIAVWDGKSAGTAHMIECARAYGLPVHIHRFQPPVIEAVSDPNDISRLMFGDTEAFSTINLKKSGVYKYSEGGGILLYAHAVGDGEIIVDDFVTDGGPSSLLEHRLRDPKLRLVFHNVQFDRTMTYKSLPHLKTHLPLARWECMQVRALAHALPGGLEKLCEVFGLPPEESKMKRGKELVKLFTAPQKITRKNPHMWFGPWTHPSEWAEFKEYAKRDVAAMRIIYKQLPRWNYDAHDPQEIPLELCNGGQREYRFWLLDQKINMRGVRIDIDLAKKIVELAGNEQERLADATKAMTRDELESTTQTAKTLGYILKTYGVEMPNLRSATVAGLIEDILKEEDNGELPTHLQELIKLLKIRLDSSKTANKKAERVLDCICVDGYARGLLQFDGAPRTLRWAGRLIQPQNFPRVDVEDAREWWGVKKGEKLSDEKVAQYVRYQRQAVKEGWARLSFGRNIKAACTNILKGLFIPNEGEHFYVADLSNIEGRGLITLSGEQWKIEAFRAYDAGNGFDLYKLAYARAFGINPAEVTGDQRQIGKVLELAMGYEGGVGAFVTMAMTYKLKISALAEKAFDTLPQWALDEARKFLEWKYEKAYQDNDRITNYGKNVNATTISVFNEAKLEARLGLTEKEFLTCDALKRMWRRAHPETVQFWGDCKAAFIAAIYDGEGYKLAEHMDYFRYKNPNSKLLELTREDGTRYWKVGKYLEFDRVKAWVRIKLPSGRYLVYPQAKMRSRGQPCYNGINPKNFQWQTINTYGGKIVENIVQAFSRDIMAWAMIDIDADGFDIRLTVHDEIVATRRIGQSTHEAFAAFMAKTRYWCTEIPLAAKGAELEFYEKT